MRSRRLRVLVLSGGPSSEHEVSLHSARLVLKNLDRRKYEPSLVKIEKNGRWKFDSGRSLNVGDAMKRMATPKFDFVFIALHGSFGEDGRVQALLEAIRLPYSGSGILSSAMTMNKHVSNTLYDASGLSVPDYIVVDKETVGKSMRFRLPAVVKPVEGGSSVGISIVKIKKALRSALAKAFKEDDRVMVQKYINGREFTCGVLDGKDGEPFALPPTEIIPKTSSFFDYRAKYEKGGSLEITPPQLPKSQIKALQVQALAAHKVLGCRGMSRSDFMMSGGKFYILETNTIPGMTQTSLLPQAAQVAGVNFPAMLDLIIKAGLRAKGKRV